MKLPQRATSNSRQTNRHRIEYATERHACKTRWKRVEKGLLEDDHDYPCTLWAKPHKRLGEGKRAASDR